MGPIPDFLFPLGRGCRPNRRPLWDKYIVRQTQFRPPIRIRRLDEPSDDIGRGDGAGNKRCEGSPSCLPSTQDRRDYRTPHRR